MAVGDRIKRARNLRGMTQKELGIAIGFEEKSADIRIAQYESNTRTPKEELLRKIALPVHEQVPGREARMIGNRGKGVHLFICVPGRIRPCGL